MLQSLTAITHEAFPMQRVKATPLGGGINQTARVDIGSERYFVKYKSDAPDGFFAAEAHGLDLLRRHTNSIRIPQVIKYDERSGTRPAYLILEWLQVEPPDTDFGERFGYALAELHQVTDPTYGLERDNFIGELPQPNQRTASWVDFYRDQRIRPQMEQARDNGYLNPHREALLTALMDRLDDLIGDVPSVPSLLHGDMWSGNFAAVNYNGVYQPTIYDPAVYYGEREVEIAFTELFGGFPSRFYSAYDEAFPRESGYAERRELYQLYPLLVHLNLFGESYGVQVDRICRHYTSRTS